ncbi:mRNA splicing protein [Myotisia sp. PD_48]|nr:mRNA splicing protein [Myotisia sp. PD_48]
MSRKPTNVPSKERNEYIPTFISKKPFYIDDDSAPGDYLEHQRLHKSKTDDKWYDRGKRVGPAATKFRKGACENCGAITHKTKECLSRPRKQGAKWTGKDIQADEKIQKVDLGWDAKRDRWNGYDAREYQNVVQEYEELESLKKQTQRKLNGEEMDSPDGDNSDENEDDRAEAKYAEESEMGRQQAKGTRNLRIREDTAKYLLNLDVDSAKYDPKTRTMVDMGAQADQAAEFVAEEKSMRVGGDVPEFLNALKYAWESQERGDKSLQHLQANPTSGEYFRKKHNAEIEAKKAQHRKTLLEKYGGDEHLQPAPLLAVTENEKFVEYDESGAIKGEPKPTAKSKYKENILINNHKSVWGSWWSNFTWGYACCHSTVKNSYCTGADGIKAFEESQHMLLLDPVQAGQANKDLDEIAKERETPETPETPEATNNDKAKKRTLHDMQLGVTEDELEAYKRSRNDAADPMAAFLGKDELVS